VPGLYVLNDVYHYDGSANALVFNGAAQLGVEAKFTADFLPLTYVTKWKILGGTYAFGVTPAIMSRPHRVDGSPVPPPGFLFGKIPWTVRAKRGTAHRRVSGAQPWSHLA